MNSENNNRKDIGKNALQPGVLLEGKRYKYTIKKVLGRGSFGITYLATVKLEGGLGAITSKVALKEFYMGDINGREGSHVTSGNKEGLVSDYRKKFIREAKNLGEVTHENIINVLEVFEANGTVYYAMQYIEGGSLDDYIKRNGRMKEDETVNMVLKMANALKTLHDRGMVHLDIKPSNVMLTEDLNPVLIDFGLSKHFDENGAPEASTKIGAGTPGYSPVEQASYRVGRGIPLTMDVYALGATMYKMLTGERPPEASVILNALADPKENLIKANVSPMLTDIVQKAMSPLIRQRYQNMGELIDALSSVPQTAEVISSIPADGANSLKEKENKIAEEEARKRQEAEAARKAKEEAARKAKEEEARKAKEEAARKAKEEEERRAAQEIARKKREAEEARKAMEERKAAEERTIINTPPSFTADSSTPSPDAVPESYDEPKKKIKTVPLVIGCIVGLVIVGAIIFFATGNKSGDADNTTSVENAAQVPTTVQDLPYNNLNGECSYTGEVDPQNRPNGKGVAKFKNGNVYDGQWAHGVMEGQATYTLANGDTFEGTWLNDEYSEGRYTVKADGSYYEGKFKNGNGYQDGGSWYDKTGKQLPW